MYSRVFLDMEATWPAAQASQAADNSEMEAAFLAKCKEVCGRSVSTAPQEQITSSTTLSTIQVAPPEKLASSAKPLALIGLVMLLYCIATHQLGSHCPDHLAIR